MAILNIRKLPEDVHKRLRLRAARAGRSMEAEARAILAEACKHDDNLLPISGLQDWVDRLYGDNKPTNVVSKLISERRSEAAKE